MGARSALREQQRQDAEKAKLASEATAVASNKDIGSRVKYQGSNTIGTIVDNKKRCGVLSVQVKWDDGTTNLYMGKEYNKITV
jgi:hypothetical protein